MDIGSDVASVASLIGEPVRAAMLAALVDGRALPAGELAFIGNVAPQTASFHLRKLLEASLLTVERQGRHSYYRLTSESVAAALEALAALGPARRQAEVRARGMRAPEYARELRFARSCYRHLAGRLAVDVTRALITRRLVEAGAERRYTLTVLGEEWFNRLGVDAPGTGRACIDWTERRHHIGGPLGVALLSCRKDLGWLVANAETRAVRVTHTGQRELGRQLGVSC
jgi:DNA-binding transcriptional ArsR family regulator